MDAAMKRLVFVFIIAVIAAAPAAHAAAEVAAGYANHVSGSLFIIRDEALVQIRQGDPIYPADIISTGDSGRVKLNLGDGSTVYIAPKSQITIDHYMVKFGYRISGHFNMHWGKARFVVENLEGLDANFSVKGKKATIKVKGTDFTMIEPDGEGQSQVMLHTGEIIADIVNDPGHIIKAGTVVRIDANGLSSTKPIRPADQAALGISTLAFSGSSTGFGSSHRFKAASGAVDSVSSLLSDLRD